MKIKVLSLLLVLVFVASIFVACDDPQTNITQLKAPIVIANGQTVSWIKVEGAVGYDVYVNGVKKETTTNTYYIASGSGEQEIYVISVGDGVAYSNSPRSNKVVCTVKNQDATKQQVFINTILEDGSWDYSGDLDYALDFVEEHQGKDAELLELFEDVYVEQLDKDGGYRGEFWGKTIRGAVLSYRYSLDEELYTVIENSAKRILSVQKDDGRFANADADTFFQSWGLWGPHYVVLGMLHFYSICKDEALKTQVLDACKAQMNYIIDTIKEQNIDILTITDQWGGLPNTRVLQASISLYCLTNDQKYLDFTEYLISTGGCTMKSSEGRTILEDCMLKTPMYKWGCRKVYEVTNFFAGILDYYILTGDEYSKQLSLNYFELISATEITFTGGVATEVEEANNAVVEQADPDNLGRMQENCALVAVYKFFAKIYQTFDIIEAIEYIERAYYNVVMGTVDYDYHFDLPFFSYSPCGCMARSTIYSGGAHVKDRFYSCCVAMGNGLLGLVPQLSVTKMTEGLSVNMYFSGTVTATTPTGKEVKLINDTTLPKEGDATIRVSLAESETFTLRFRIPEWSANSTLKINGVPVKNVNPGGYVSLTREWRNGDAVEISFDMTAKLNYGSEDCSNENAKYNVVVTRGPIAFARDRRIEGDTIFDPITFDDKDGVLDVKVIDDVSFRNQVAIKVKTKTGYVTLVDYGSAGKTQSDDSIMCLWIPTVDYWSQDITKDVVVRCYADGSPNGWNNDVLVTSQSYKDTTNKELLANFAWRFIPVENTNAYRILDVNSNKYLTVHSNGYTITRQTELTNDDSQLFYLHEVGLNRYKISGKYDKLITVYDITLETYMFNDINHDLQYWYLENL